MEFNAVYHQASDNYCYPLNEDELIINIKNGLRCKIGIHYTRRSVCRGNIRRRGALGWKKGADHI